MEIQLVTYSVRMTDFNLMIANNIFKALHSQQKTTTELAKFLEISREEMRKMLSGEKTISKKDLEQIAKFLSVKVSNLSHISQTDTISNLKTRVASEEAKCAVNQADVLSDMIIFHTNVRKNAQKQEIM